MTVMMLAGCGKTDVKTDNKVTVKDTSVTETSAETEAVTELDSSPDAAESADSKDNKKNGKKKKDSSSSEAEKEAEPLYVVETHGPRAYDGAAEYDDFSDALFIGDSRTVGLMLNGNKPQADYFASAGLNVITVQETPVVPRSEFAEEITAAAANVASDDEEDDGPDLSGNMLVPEAIKYRKYRRVFLNFGVNELGWPYPETFVEKYELLISQVRQAQPNATIYIESMLPVSYQALEINSCYNSPAVDAFNEDYIRRVALETGCVYMDVNRFFRDSRGDLYYGAAGDGIHMIRAYCLEWMDILAYYTTGDGNLIEISHNITAENSEDTNTTKLGDDGLPETIVPDSLPDQIIPDLSSADTSSADDTVPDSQEDSSDGYDDNSYTYSYEDTYSYDDYNYDYGYGW